jgi:hypothetical protein
MFDMHQGVRVKGGSEVGTVMGQTHNSAVQLIYCVWFDPEHKKVGWYFAHELEAA